MSDGLAPVVLRVEATGSRFAAPRRALCRFSKVAASMLEGADDSEELPLASEHSTDDTVARYVAWLMLHCDPASRVTRISLPLPREDKVSLFSAADLRFIETLLVPGGDMTDSAHLFMFMGLSVFLGSQISLELAAAYLAYQVRQASDASVAEGKHGTSGVRKWFGAEGDYSGEELERLSLKYQWLRGVDHAQLERESEDAHDVAAANAPAAPEAPSAAAPDDEN